MAFNVEQELNTVAIRLSGLWRQEIVRQDLVDTGLLRDTIRWTVQKTANGYELDLFAQDYFKYLDDKYDVSYSIRQSSEFQSIMKDLARIMAFAIIEDVQLFIPFSQ